MSSCPGCDERLAALPPDDRARIPLRKAANAWREANDQLSELVVDYGSGDDRVKAQEAIVEACDDALVVAAISYANHGA